MFLFWSFLLKLHFKFKWKESHIFNVVSDFWIPPYILLFQEAGFIMQVDSSCTAEICVCVCVYQESLWGTGMQLQCPEAIYSVKQLSTSSCESRTGHFGEKTSEDREQCPVHIKTSHRLLLHIVRLTKPIGPLTRFTDYTCSDWDSFILAKIHKLFINIMKEETQKWERG